MIFERISLEEGLSQSLVYCILQDKDGYMWFGTQEGLNKYDGHNIKIFKHSTDNKRSICNNYIRALFEDKSGIIWVGTLNGGFSKYNKNLENFSNFNLNLNPPDCDLIYTIKQLNDDELIVGTSKGGLKIFKLYDNSVSNFFNPDNLKNLMPYNDISALLIDKNDQKWIGTLNEGLINLDKEGNILKNYKSEVDNYTTISNERILCIYESKEGEIFIGTKKGVNIYDSRNRIFKNYFLENGYNDLTYCYVTSICEDKNGSIWFGTKTSGLIKMNQRSKIEFFTNDLFNPHSLSSNSIYSLYNDNSNVMWIGTADGGVCKVDCERKKFFTVTKVNDNEESIYLKNIHSIFVINKNSIIVGTYNIGILNIIKENNIENTFSLFKNNLIKILPETINCIQKDENNNLWISSFNGNLYRYNIVTDELKKFEVNSYINSIFLQNNTVWITTLYDGLLKFKINTGNFIKETICNQNLNKIFCIHMDNLNILWLGTENEGIINYHPDKRNMTNYKFDEHNPKSISDNFVISINEDNIGNIWIGTYSGGLNKFNREKEIFERFSLKEGLHDNIKGILFDDENNLWLSTNIGLIRFDPDLKIAKKFDYQDGLQSNEFNDGACFKDINGIMYFGGINGITYFHPSEIKDNPYIPNIVITDFEIFNKPVTGGPDNPFLKKNITYADEINLTYKESVFSFKFAALIFNNPQKNQYAYKMEGFDKDWTYSGTRRRVTYTNLDPGVYTFRVKGSNNDGIWNEEGTSIRINISPPYWKTWWFKSLGALSLIAATGITYRKRLEQMEKERNAQEEFSRKLIEAQENEKKRIAKELHDTIAHEVLISKQKAMMALKHRNDPGRLEKALEEISELSSATISEVRNIAYNMHPHQLERLGFTKAIRSIINDVSRSTDINFVFDTDNVDEVLSKESEINLFRVVQETISNIIKHSGATEVILKVMRKEDCIEILIVDNGKGFDIHSKAFDEARQGFGLSGIEERIKFMNGEINIDSELNKGTTLKFKIPIVKSDE